MAVISKGQLLIFLCLLGTISSKPRRSKSDVSPIEAPAEDQLQRGVGETLQDDEDFLADEASGAGPDRGSGVDPTEPGNDGRPTIRDSSGSGFEPTEPTDNFRRPEPTQLSSSEFYRVRFRAMSLEYKPELGNRLSVPFLELSRQVAAEVQKLYDNTPGQQTASVIQLDSREKGEGEYETVVVTLDLSTQGFYDEPALRKVFEDALPTEIGPYSTTLDDFQFRKLGSGTTCANAAGPEPKEYPRLGDNWANLIINQAFPCAGYVTAFEFWRGTVEGTAYIGVWRMAAQQQFMLIAKVAAVPQEVGVNRIDLETPIAVREGDFVGIHYDRDARTGIVPHTIEADNLVSSNELYEVYTAEVFNDQIPIGTPIHLQLFSGGETKKRFGLKSIIDYNYKPPTTAAPPVCNPPSFLCDSGRCIPSHKRCNSQQDCVDNTDELGCPHHPVRVLCLAGQFLCANNKKCIDPALKCNGENDCEDASDERGCAPRACLAGQFRCNTGVCINSLQKCDGQADCADSSDEIGCPSIPCLPGQFRCENGPCIDGQYRCDGRIHCPDTTDELDCPVACRASEFQCGDGRCIDTTKKCDGHRHCADGADEEDCHFVATVANCLADEYTCNDGRCIDERKLCDGEPDCRDGGDELNCQTPAPTCPSDEFTCGDGSCIDNRNECDGASDCPDGTDEVNCPTTQAPTCPSNEFTCGDGTCIANEKKCDGTPDCRDRTDELNCPTMPPPTCSPSEFQCGDESCIGNRRKCDGAQDCRDGSDEQNCPTTTQPTTPPTTTAGEGGGLLTGEGERVDYEDGCQDSEFECRSGECIEAGKKCDRRTDCRDGSDEDNCPCRPEIEFQCADGTCIDARRKCDQRADCLDRSDELNCPVRCTAADFTCLSGECIDIRRKCDKARDCRDGSDEQGCPKECKARYEFTCLSGQCIDNRRKCDGYSDCVDGSDERHCSGGCTDSEFACASGDQCVDVSKKCDKTSDCRDGSDEAGCPVECTDSEFKCVSGECIDVRRKCDKRDDCRDGSDEQNCPVECTDSEFKCVSGECIDVRRKCDKRDDCRDGSDEQNCPVQCQASEFTCRNGDCVDNRRRCDGRYDCSDTSDEEGCPKQCRSSEFKCGTGECIDARKKCDGSYDCRDGTDEIGCAKACEDTEFTCGTGECIAIQQKCDGNQDCRDDTDETGCPTRCRDGQFQCRNGQCIDASLRCNREYNCRDGTDEFECRPTRCRDNEFRCRSGECIDSSRKCDRRSDCRDGSDELECPVQCRPNQFKCVSGECIDARRKCDKRRDCGDGSDEADCVEEVPIRINVAPPSLRIREGQRAMFICRTTGNPPPKVRWSRNGQQLPQGATDVDGVLTIGVTRAADSGQYTCSVIGVAEDIRASGRLMVDVFGPTLVPPTDGQCRADTDTRCNSGQCIPKDYLCDGDFDCADKSDEANCVDTMPCEPNEHRCDSGKCIQSIWWCDGDNDCGDNSDENICPTSAPGAPCKKTEYQCQSRDQCIPASYQCDSEVDCQDQSDELGCAPPIVLRSPPGKVEVDQGETVVISCEARGTPVPLIVWRLNWGHIPDPPRVSTTSEGGIGTLTIRQIRESDQGAYTCEALNNKGSVFAQPDAIVTIKPPSGLCLPPLFHAEAKSVSECLNCFCFGVTDQCVSSKLRRSQLSIGSQIAMINYASQQTMDPNYIQFNPGTRQFSVADYGSITRDGTYYWNLPRQFLGNKLSSYGGNLYYTMYYMNRGGSRQVGGAEVIMKGNGITVQFNSPSPHSAATEFSRVIPLVESDWTLLRDAPLRGDQGPARGDSFGQPASRSDLMMVLQNVEFIYIKSKFDEYLDEIRVSQVFLDVGVDPSSGSRGDRASLVEMCTCPEGYTGLSCDKCARGYRRQSVGRFLGRCIPCDCNKHTDDCDADTGICVSCQHNTEGDKCEKCKAGYYGNASGGTSTDCLPCPCPLTDTRNQFSKDCYVDPLDTQITCRGCPREYTGRRCEQCAPGYIGNPKTPGDYCRPSQQSCDPRGSLSSTPDTNDQCPCKRNAQGKSCGQCGAGAFYLSTENPDGCLKCFCNGVTDMCASSGWYRTEVRSNFDPARFDGFVLSNAARTRTVDSEFDVDIRRNQLMYRRFSALTPYTYYWILPEKFLGDKVGGYGGKILFTVNYQAGSDPRPNNDADIEIKGNGIVLMYTARQPLQAAIPQAVQVPLTESYWMKEDGSQVSREEFLMVLADIDTLMIKATYARTTAQSSISDVIFETAENRNSGGDRALTVEQCQCPPGYQGLSCHDCRSGYRREKVGRYLGRCVPCDCNRHAANCDTETGKCESCQHNAIGDRCERCASGFYGDARRGTSNDCQACPCPLTSRENQFSKECFLASDRQVTCRNCPQGYRGRNCESCAPGYKGDPRRPGDTCKREGEGQEGGDGGTTKAPGKCERCDERGVVPGSTCDPATQTCGCKDNVGGSECDTCKAGHFHLTKENPRGCLQCWCSGQSTKCRSCQQYRSQVRPFFSQDGTSNFALVYKNDPRTTVVLDGFSLNGRNKEVRYDGFNQIRGSNRLYWRLPPRFSGDKVSSYGGNLKFTVEYENDPRLGGDFFSDTDLEIISGNNRFHHVFDPPSSRSRQTEYSIVLNERTFKKADGTVPTRLEFLQLLANIDYILIRAANHRDMRSTAIKELSMDITVAQNTGQHPALMVEECTCPEGYRGLSCELCEQGYQRVEDPRYPLGRCVRCSCNSHSARCDDSGKCVNCLHNTAGDYCERCADGFYGDPRRGTPNDCQPCPCPLPVASNQFAPTCRRDTDGGVTCLRCEQGYVGRNCERCDTGYTGNPMVPGGSCQKVAISREPVVTVYPNRVTKMTGDVVRFTCNVQGPQPMRVTWARTNGRPLPRRASVTADNSLSINGLISSDGGGYTCTAVNTYGRTEGTVLLKVMVIQDITVRVEEPKFLTVDAGTTVRFVCAGISQVTYNLLWTKQGGNLPDQAMDENGVLTIPNAKLEDSGTYVCTGSNPFSIDTDIATLTVGVTVESPTVRIEPRYQAVNYGERVEFRCIAMGRPEPTLEWARTSGQLNSEATFINGVFIIPFARKTDEAEYACKASNTAGEASTKTILYVKGDAGPNFALLRRSELTVPVGAEARFICSVRGTQRATITWSKQGAQQLPQGSRVERGELIIPNVRKVDAGNYECHVRVTTGETGTVIATLYVVGGQQESHPAASIDPAQLILAQGTSGTLRCVVTGQPQPRITWQWSGGDLTSNHQVNNDVLRIVRASLSDRGIYKCIARNFIGENQASARVEVERREPPQVEIFPKTQQTMTAGSSALFQCRVTAGYPKPTLSWRRAEGQRLTANTQILENGVIRFDRINGPEQGSYICTATNTAGTTTATATLRVQAIPRITVQPTSPIRVRVGQPVVFECRAEGEPNPNVYWQRVQPRGTAASPSSDPRAVSRPGLARYTINAAAVTDAGLYICIASNDAGRVEERMEIIVVGEPTVPPLPNGGISIDGARLKRIKIGENVEFTCRAQDAALELHWSRDRGILPVSHRVRSGVLYLYNAQPEYSGRYICSASATHDGESYREYVDLVVVGVVLPKISIGDGIKEVKDGDPAQLICDVTTEGSVEIKWERVEGTIAAYAVDDGYGYLRFPYVTQSDAGRYRCVARNDAGSVNAILELFIINNVTGGVLTGDGDADYDDGCKKTEFQCGDGKCIDGRRKCDRRTDCTDGSDELDCPCNPLLEFRCGDGQCIDNRRKCDARTDCRDGSDERNCQCKTTEFRCGDGACIDARRKCDQRQDCRDGSDENDCRCRDTEFRCGSGRCIDAQRKCDGRIDCRDQSDEQNCQCKATEFRCSDGQCIDARRKCDARSDCRDGSDEQNCACKMTEFRCGDGMCIDARRKCDQRADCRDGSDERNCQCQSTEFRCGNGQCIEAGRKCDGHADCRDATDEQNCRSSETLPRLTITAPQKQPVEGDTITFECLATGTPTPTVYWKRAGESVTTPGQSGIARLTIQRISAADTGEYICLASNYLGQAEGRVVITVESRVGGRGVLPTVSPQILQIDGEDVRRVRVGDDTVFICRTRDPAAIINWTKQRDDLPANHRQQLGSLYLYKLTPEQGGIYVCTASIGGDSYREHVTLMILGPDGGGPGGPNTEPRLTIIAPQERPVEGESLSFECRATGTPTPTVYWRKAGSRSTTPGQLGTATYTIPRVSAADSGEYICIASNAVGQAEGRVIIAVRSRGGPVLPTVKPQVIQIDGEDLRRAAIGDDVTFICRHRDTNAVITWSRERGILPIGHRQQGGSLYLYNVRPEYSGIYVCNANIGGEIFRDQVELFVPGGDAGGLPKSRPQLSITAPQQQPVAGETIAFECRATGNPTPTVYWKRAGFSRTTPGERGVARLILERISAADAGEYICLATNSLGQAEGRVVVTVEGRGGEVRPTVKQQVLQIEGGDLRQAGIGDDITFICRSRDPNSNIHWSRERGAIPVNHRQSSGSLYLYNVQPDHSGVYVCSSTAGHDGTSYRDQVELRIVGAVLPRINIGEPLREVRLGDAVTLICDVQTAGVVDISWDRPEARLSPYVVDDGRGYLDFPRTTINDAGKYRCTARSSTGTTEGFVDLVILAVPSASIGQESVTVALGRTAKLRCLVTGSPQPRITWAKDGGKLPAQITVEKGVLTIYNFKESDAGNYLCTAANAAGSARAYVTINIDPTTTERIQKDRASPGGEVGTGGRGVDNGDFSNIQEIASRTQTVSVGDRVEFTCEVIGNPPPTIRWVRDLRAVPTSAIITGSQMVIPRVALEDAGKYRCIASNRGGTRQASIELFVRSSTVHPGNTNWPLNAQSLVKTASIGTDVVLTCEAPNIRNPTLRWSRRDKELPRNRLIEEGALTIRDVKAEDSGKYVCRVSAPGIQGVEQLIELVVGALVPYFIQNPSSYIAYRTLLDAYLEFEIEIFFKPESNNGIILYNGQKTDGGGDFLSFGLNEGYAEFRYDCGSGPALIRSEAPLTLGQWHSVSLKRNRRTGTMVIDGKEYTGTSQGRFQGLDLSQLLYIGGVPDYNIINRRAGFTSGFIGAISRIDVRGIALDLGQAALAIVGVADYPVCRERPCQNGATCVPANADQGYKCHCRKGYTGYNCELVGMGCFPGACGSRGRCYNLPNGQGFQCACPIGKTGERCQIGIKVEDPAFNRTSYISYDPLQNAAMGVEIEILFKPKSLEDGILLYNAQQQDGRGDFMALLIKNRRLEFRFDSGSGVAVIRSNELLIQDKWTLVHLERNQRDGSLSINGGVATKAVSLSESSSPGNTLGLNMKRQLYLGGVDQGEVISAGVGVDVGFVGCVTRITINKKSLVLIASAIGSANILDCGDNLPCSRRPCSNGGACQADDEIGYTCQCPATHTGRHCEIEINVCITHSPCKNGGECQALGATGYKCRCRLGFMGRNCQEAVVVHRAVYLQGDGFMEFPTTFLPHRSSQLKEVIELSFATNKTEGLIFWHGQDPLTSGQGSDYLAIALRDGHVEFSYELGSGIASIVTRLKFSDGRFHKVKAERTGKHGKLSVDTEVDESGDSAGILQMLNTKGNIYMGGVPDFKFMTAGRYRNGFHGCIKDIKFMEGSVLNVQRTAVTGYNIQPCH
ncbi:basement membrane-specific heparan sulfate proteoglycan core protein-like isoform X7 [Lineus longissimus]|uniref:basement membrane-specific heparan sulfate proteoglycan core protein-like isoform X7 n=1 Tax=Lineus longissimus TaxID=88925 RepID=UPI00315D3C9B